MKTIFLFFLFCTCSILQAQRWADRNVGVYPNAIQTIINAKNHSVGIRFDHLFEKPAFGLPVSLYGSFSRTIKPNLYINNYRWENKYSIGAGVTLPEDEVNEIHTIATIGLIYYQLPVMWVNEDLPPVHFRAGYVSTVPIGIDLGWRVQIHKFTMGFQIDVMNWFQYAQISMGYCFSFYK